VYGSRFPASILGINAWASGLRGEPAARDEMLIWAIGVRGIFFFVMGPGDDPARVTDRVSVWGLPTAEADEGTLTSADRKQRKNH
jgi:hypothetical protein